MTMRKHLILPAVLLAGLVALGGCAYTAGNVDLARGDYAAAETRFKSILADHPDDSVARSRLGTTYYRAGRYNEAAAQFEAALAGRPADPDDQLYLGLSLIGAGERDRGFAVLASFVHPDIYRIQEAVRAEAALLDRSPGLPLPPLSEIESRLRQAWTRGEDLHNQERSDSNKG